MQILCRIDDWNNVIILGDVDIYVHEKRIDMFIDCKRIIT